MKNEKYYSYGQMLEYVLRTVEEDFVNWQFLYRQDITDSVTEQIFLNKYIDVKIDFASVHAALMYPAEAFQLNCKAMLVVTDCGVYLWSGGHHARFVSFATTIPRAGFKGDNLYFCDMYNKRLSKVNGSAFNVNLELLGWLFLNLQKEFVEWKEQVAENMAEYKTRTTFGFCRNQKRIIDEICRVKYPQYIKLVESEEVQSRLSELYDLRRKGFEREVTRDLDLYYQSKSCELADT